MNQYDLRFDLKINVGHYDLYFIVQWFCLESWRLFDVWTAYFGIMNQYDPTFALKINVGHYDIFHCPLIFIISWRLFDVWTSYFGIIDQYEKTFDLKINVGHFDLYFMVQYFAFYLEDYFMYVHLFWDYESVWPEIWPQTKWKVIVTYILWFSVFALYLEDYLMYEHHYLGLWFSMTRCLTYT